MRNYNPMSLKSMSGIVLDIIMVLMISFYSTVGWTTLMHYLLFPKTPIFLPTIISPEWADSRVVYWAYSIFVTYYAFAIWQTMQALCISSCLSICEALYFKHFTCIFMYLSCSLNFPTNRDRISYRCSRTNVSFIFKDCLDPSIGIQMY
jgi:hypothetical protein